MPEAEVALRLAFSLLDQAEENAHALIAIDGACVQIRAHMHLGRLVDERIIFNIAGFLAANGCVAECLRDGWRGTYRRNGKTLVLRSARGFDVQFVCKSRRVIAECKGGLTRPTGRGAYSIIATAIGQAIVSDLERAGPFDELWVAVPDAPAYERAADQIIGASRAFAATGIRIALVGEEGVRLLGDPPRS